MVLTGRSDDPGAAVKVNSGVEPYRLLAPLRTTNSGAELSMAAGFTARRSLLASRSGLDHRRASPRRPITKSRLGDRGPISTNALLSPKCNRKVEFTPTRVVAEDAADEASIDWHHGSHNRSGNRAGLGASSLARNAAGTMGTPCPLSLQRTDPEGCVSSGADKPLGT
jgi:hypothetical protein